MKPTLVLLMLALLITPAARAQSPELSPLVEGLEVVARLPGPAMWRVRRGDAELVIFGTVTPIPHLLAWDQTRLKRQLSGARRLLIPGRSTAGPIAAARFLVRDGPRLRVGPGQPILERLEPSLSARFAAAAAAARVKPARYDRWKPGMAGALLWDDYEVAAGLSSAKPATTVARLAKTLRVPAVEMAKVDIGGFLHDAAAMTDAEHLSCLRMVLDELGRTAPAPAALGEAWARGDLRSVAALYPHMEGCPVLSPVLNKQVSDTVSALLAKGLDASGRTVALVDMNLLLRPDGVLDRLAATGATVDTP